MKACAGAEPPFSDPSESRHQLHTRAVCTCCLACDEYLLLIIVSRYQESDTHMSNTEGILEKEQGRSTWRSKVKQREAKTLFMTSNAAIVRCPSDMFGKCNAADKKRLQIKCVKHVSSAWNGLPWQRGKQDMKLHSRGPKEPNLHPIRFTKHIVTSWAHGQAARH